MSLITHRCTRCGHPDYWRQAANGPCSCGCACQPGEPEVRPTWDVASQRVQRIVKPGEKLGHGLAAIRLCGCKDCKALYEQQKAGTAA